MNKFFASKIFKIVSGIFIGIIFVIIAGTIILQTTLWMKFPPVLRSTFAIIKLDISIQGGRCDEGCMVERQVYRSIIVQDAKANSVVLSRVRSILFDRKANPKLRAEMVWVYKAITPEGELPEDLLGLLEEKGASDILKQTLIAATAGSSKSAQKQLLIAADSEEDEWTRIVALAQLQGYGDISMINSLIEIMKSDPRGEVGDKAAIAIGDILYNKGKEILSITQSQKEYFISVLLDGEKYPVDRRTWVIEILKDYKTQDIIKVFENLLDDQCGWVREDVAKALKNITGKEYLYKSVLPYEEELKICPDY